MSKFIYGQQNHLAKKMFSNVHITEEDEAKKDLEISMEVIVRNSKAARFEKMPRNGHKITAFNGKTAIVDIAASAEQATQNERHATRANYFYYNAKNKNDFKNWFDKFAKK